MEKSAINAVCAALFLMAAFLSSNFIGGVFWYVLSVAFLIAGVYGIVCVFKGTKFLV